MYLSNSDKLSLMSIVLRDSNTLAFWNNSRLHTIRMLQPQRGWQCRETNLSLVSEKEDFQASQRESYESSCVHRNMTYAPW
jgi:spore coat polysaccharide biosynthesis protein SpsF (cytidylyltransferase family)